MRFEAARAEGERVVAELLRKIRQDSGNAKWIGRIALSKIEERFAGARTTDSSTTPIASMPTETITTEVIDTLVPPESSDTLSAWSILSASELIEYLANCSQEDAARILAEERLKLGRASVIEAATRRLDR